MAVENGVKSVAIGYCIVVMPLGGVVIKLVCLSWGTSESEAVITDVAMCVVWSPGLLVFRSAHVSL